MPDPYDVIVAGVGTIGSATCWQLAARGARVLGLEQFDLPHSRGAHHGYSRMIRLAYYEHSAYVALVKRAYTLWDQLEGASGQKLLYKTGGLYIGSPEGNLVSRSLAASRQYGLNHELLDRAELARRHPSFHVPDSFAALYEPEAGFLVPHRCVAAFIDQALRNGADLRGHEPLVDWQADDEGVTVYCAGGQYRARTLISCGGAWSQRLLGRIGVDLTVTRQVMGWFWPRRPQIFGLGQLPVWAIEGGGGGLHYGFPMVSDNPGFKISLHLPAEPTDPDNVQREPMDQDLPPLRAGLRDWLPDADGPLLALRVCLYTNSPDAHFIIDRHPHHRRVIVACGFSGHGFKFAPVIGELLAQMALDGRAAMPIKFFSLKRFGDDKRTED